MHSDYGPGNYGPQPSDAFEKVLVIMGEIESLPAIDPRGSALAQLPDPADPHASLKARWMAENEPDPGPTTASSWAGLSTTPTSTAWIMKRNADCTTNWPITPAASELSTIRSNVLLAISVLRPHADEEHTQLEGPETEPPPRRQRLGKTLIEGVGNYLIAAGP
jgi:hypothetical protein